MRPALSLAVLLAFLIGSAAVAAPKACPDGLHPALAAELFFGRNIGQVGEVSDADWKSFLDEEVTPRFPGGLSVSDIYGQWRSPAGAFVREPSKALFLVLTGSREERRRIDLVREAYKRRFHQASVLLVEERACVSF